LLSLSVIPGWLPGLAPIIDLGVFDPIDPTFIPYITISLRGEEQQVLNIKQICFIDIRDV